MRGVHILLLVILVLCVISIVTTLALRKTSEKFSVKSPNTIQRYTAMQQYAGMIGLNQKIYPGFNAAYLSDGNNIFYAENIQSFASLLNIGPRTLKNGYTQIPTFVQSDSKVFDTLFQLIFDRRLPCAPYITGGPYKDLSYIGLMKNTQGDPTVYSNTYDAYITAIRHYAAQNIGWQDAQNVGPIWFALPVDIQNNFFPPLVELYNMIQMSEFYMKVLEDIVINIKPYMTYTQFVNMVRAVFLGVYTDIEGNTNDVENAIASRALTFTKAIMKIRLICRNVIDPKSSFTNIPAISTATHTAMSKLFKIYDGKIPSTTIEFEEKIYTMLTQSNDQKTVNAWKELLKEIPNLPQPPPPRNCSGINWFSCAWTTLTNSVVDAWNNIVVTTWDDFKNMAVDLFTKKEPWYDVFGSIASIEAASIGGGSMSFWDSIYGMGTSTVINTVSPKNLELLNNLTINTVDPVTSPLKQGTQLVTPRQPMPVNTTSEQDLKIIEDDGGDNSGLFLVYAEDGIFAGATSFRTGPGPLYVGIRTTGPLLYTAIMLVASQSTQMKNWNIFPPNFFGGVFNAPEDVTTIWSYYQMTKKGIPTVPFFSPVYFPRLFDASNELLDYLLNDLGVSPQEIQKLFYQANYTFTGSIDAAGSFNSWNANVFGSKTVLFEEKLLRLKLWARDRENILNTTEKMEKYINFFKEHVGFDQHFSFFRTPEWYKALSQYQKAFYSGGSFALGPPSSTTALYVFHSSYDTKTVRVKYPTINKKETTNPAKTFAEQNKIQYIYCENQKVKLCDGHKQLCNDCKDGWKGMFTKKDCEQKSSNCQKYNLDK